jgi:hypothetical protein
MIKRFRAWDGEAYWYSDDNLSFILDYKITGIQTASFELKDVEQFIGKKDCNGVMIYENDLIRMIMPAVEKTYQVVWSDDDCGFRKVPYGLPYPEMKIDEAFMEVIGTIHSKAS